MEDLDLTLDQDADHQDESRRLSKTDIPIPPRFEIPGYTLERPVGRGTFGEVWLAHAHNTGRKVAVKVFTGQRGLDFPLLKREVGKLAKVVSERRIVQLLEVGWDAEHPYYVMEYLEGGSLADRLKDGPLSVDEAVPLFREVADGLMYLHGRAILHCDLKPANVLLDARGHVRLADFGQARLTEEEGPIGGTLFYLAPELAHPQARPDARSDVYALGAVLYAMLIGKPPYANEVTNRSLASSGTVRERMERYAAVLDGADMPREHHKHPDIDGDLAAIIDGCLARDPEKRFGSAHEVLEALERRDRRRSQRPLLTFGLLGPLVLTVVLLVFSFIAFETAERGAREALVEQTLAGDRALADITAAAVDRNLSAVQRRVGREARSDPLRRLLADHHSGRREPAQVTHEIQTIITELYARYRDRHFFSWLVADANGVVLARMPEDSMVIGQGFAYREWFTGRPELPVEQAHLGTPRDAPGLTLAFESRAEGHPLLVSVAAPIVAPDSDEILGVAAATLHLQTFNEWLEDTEHSEPGQCPELYVLLLNRDQLVRHPCLPDGQRPPVDGFGGRAEVAELLEQSMMDHFMATDGRTSLAVAKALGENRDWWILVVQDRETALRPLVALTWRLRYLGLVAIAVGFTILAILAGLVWRVTRQGSWS